MSPENKSQTECYIMQIEKSYWNSITLRLHFNNLINIFLLYMILLFDKNVLFYLRVLISYRINKYVYFYFNQNINIYSVMHIRYFTVKKLLNNLNIGTKKTSL